MPCGLTGAAQSWIWIMLKISTEKYIFNGENNYFS